MEPAAFLIELGRYYLLAGGIVGVLFLVGGLDRIDPAARQSYAFRPLLLPGILLIWPLVLLRWYQLEQIAKHSSQPDSGGEERT